MTAAAQKLLTWKAASGDASKKWRDEFGTMLDKGKTKNYKASDWKDAVKNSTSELKKEMDDAMAAVTEYGDLMAGFHENLHERMGNAMRMTKALADPKTATPQLMEQAEKYIAEILSDLQGPLKKFLSMSKDLQGNRLDLFKDGDITTAINGGSLAPKAELTKLLNDYKAQRKAVIDKSNQITVDHKNKVKDYEPRALDIQKSLGKFKNMGGMERDDVKKDLAKDLKEVSDFLTSGNTGNLIKLAGRPLEMLAFAKKIKSKDPVKLQQLFSDEKIGKDQVAAFKKGVDIEVLAWKVQQKKLELLETYAKKLKNDTLSGKVKKLSAIGAKNDKISAALKAEIAKIEEHFALIPST